MIMTKGQMYEIYKAKRQKLATKIRELIKTKDSKDKFQKLIKLTREYEKITADMNLDGIAAKVYPATLGSQKWVDAYDTFMKAHAENCRKAYREVKQMSDHNKYNIMLCWTEKKDHCICESVVEKIKTYFSTLNIALMDVNKTDFPDRIEVCETYKIKCSKETYEFVLRSVECLISLLTESAYETCNIGVFGKNL
jgi:hypothetical protein